MGFGGMSLGSLLLIFMICVLLFGTKRLRSLGEDLGRALSGFKHGLKEGADIEHLANTPEIKSSMNAYPASNTIADAATLPESDVNAKANRV